MKQSTSSIRVISISVYLGTSLFSGLVFADAFDDARLSTSQSDFGGVGLMQMPTGRAAPEGEFNLGGTFNDEYYHGFVSLQSYDFNLKEYS